MSDDLVKRLRDLGDRAEYMPHMHHVAADRIEELEADLHKMALDLIAADGQSQEAYQAQLLAEAKLTKAMLALDEAIYLLDPDDEDIAKETGLHRIVTSYRELKGEK